MRFQASEETEIRDAQDSPHKRPLRGREGSQQGHGRGAWLFCGLPVLSPVSFMASRKGPHGTNCPLLYFLASGPYLAGFLKSNLGLLYAKILAAVLGSL